VGEVVFSRRGITVIHDDCLTTDLVGPESVDLIVTSPPYNVDIHYNAHRDNLSYDQYLQFSEQWLSRALGWLKRGGRLCLNVPLDKNKNGQESIAADLTVMAKRLGFKYHSTVIWNEGNISRRTAWGSWLSARAPYVIAPVEVIIVLYKGSWRRQHRGESDLTREEFLEWTNGLWTFGGERRSSVRHPAPFPLELPKRCIKLFSFVGDTVLDPFLGSGTTLVAAAKLGRKGIGIEIDASYCDVALRRLKLEAGLDTVPLFEGPN
jgi:site-specific DNA-methyltransferase (adenine-specific)